MSLIPPLTAFTLSAFYLSACGSGGSVPSSTAAHTDGLVVPISYVATRGEGEAEVPGAGDDYYDEPGNQLTDGVVGGDSYGASITRDPAYEWVGWWKTAPEMTFDFGQVVQVERVLIGFNRSSRGKVALPVRVVISDRSYTLRGDELSDLTRGFLPFQGPFAKSKLTIRLEFPTGSQWVFVDEVKFERKR